MTFRPTFWPTLFTVPALIVLVALGFWQLQRLHWKDDLITKLNDRATAAAVDLPAGALGAPDEWQFRRVRVAGVFAHDKETHLLNRSLRGNPGVHVMTPLVRSDGGGAVLVDRGWVPFERRDPKDRAAGQVGGTVVVEGILRLESGQGNFVPDNEPVKNAWFFVDTQAVGRHTGIEVAPGYYIVSGDDAVPGGFPVGRQWRLDIRNDHLQYAITWFSLAVALLVIYLLYIRGIRRRGS